MRSPRSRALAHALACTAALSVGSACRRRATPPTMRPSPAVTARRGPPVTTGDPRETAFATFALDLGDAVLAAARGTPYDPRWNGDDASRDLRATEPARVEPLGALGPVPSAVMVHFALTDFTPTPAGGRAVRVGIGVYPDGRVRWLGFETQDSTNLTHPQGWWSTSAPAVQGALERSISALQGPCDLAVPTGADLAGLPARVAAGLGTATADRDAACAFARANPGTWMPHLHDEVDVLVQGGGQRARIRTHLWPRPGRVWLGPLRVSLDRGE